MGEFLDAFLKVTKKSQSGNNDILKEVTLRSEIEKICGDNLRDFGQVFTFEITKNNVEYAQAAMEHPSITGKYIIDQDTLTTYSARMRDIEF